MATEVLYPLGYAFYPVSGRAIVQRILATPRLDTMKQNQEQFNVATMVKDLPGFR
jgi:hypothetical protein